MPSVSISTRGGAKTGTTGALALAVAVTAWTGLAAVGPLEAGAAAGTPAGPEPASARRTEAAAGVPARPATEGSPAGGFRIDREGTWVVAVTDTGGLFGFLGHRHAIEVTGWSARVEWDPDRPEASWADVSVPARTLRIDTAQARDRAGLEEGPDAETVAELQDKMLGPENLAATQHPELRLELTEVTGDPEQRLRVAGTLTVRGRAEAVEFPVRVERLDGGGWVFTGSFTVRQTAFGIEPESVAGVVKVADPVEIRFRVAVSPPGV